MGSVGRGQPHSRWKPCCRRHLVLTLTPAGERLLVSVNDHRRDVFTRILRRMAPLIGRR